MKIILGVMLVFAILMVIGFIAEQSERAMQTPGRTTQSQTQTPASNMCPVSNTSTSFCIVKDGKPYYFAIEGWELPTREEVENVIKMSGYHVEGLYIWLRVRTCLDLEFDADENAYVLVGELYKEVLFGDPWFPLIKRGKDVYLLPYWFSAWREDIEALLKAKTVRLYFDVDGYYDVLPTSGCIGEICFTTGAHGPGFYINYTPPPTKLKVLGDIKGRCIKEELCLYNVTFEHKYGYLFLPFGYDVSTGKKSYADFPIHINVYVVKNGKLIPIDEYFPSTVVPPLPSSAHDIWKEPKHEHLTTVIPPGNFTLVFRAHGAIYPTPLFNNTPIVIGTPWGVAKFEPKLEVLEIASINSITCGDKLVIKEIDVVLRNTGRIPIVIPQTYFPQDAPPNYEMLKGRIDSTELIFTTQEANGRWDLGGGLALAVVVNPGETVTVSLTPITHGELLEDIDLELEPLELPMEELNRSYTILVESIYTNTSSSIIIPP